MVSELGSGNPFGETPFRVSVGEAAPRIAFERLGWQLAEKPPVSRGKLPAVPEAPALGDLMHGRSVLGGLQLLTDCIEPNRPEIGHWAQAPDQLKRIVQRPLVYLQFTTQIEYGHRLSQLGVHVIFGTANQSRPVGRRAGGPVVVRLSEQREKTSQALLLDQPLRLGDEFESGLGQVEQTYQVSPQGAATGRAYSDRLPASQALLQVAPAKHGAPLSKEITLHRQGNQLIVVGGRQMICVLVWYGDPDLARF